MYGSFSPCATDFWDFVRCQRPNGTFYGTHGKCLKGIRVGQKEKGKFIGGGLEGRVYDIGRGKVLKVSESGKSNDEAQRIATNANLAPRLIKSGTIKGDSKKRGYQIMEKVKATSILGIGQPGREAQPMETLSKEDLRKEKEAYIAMLKLNSLGVAHGDLHGGNVQWDIKRNKPVIMDFDNAVVSKESAGKEAKSLLESIGIRLENNGYYDEADAMYLVARGRGKKLFDRGRDAIEYLFPI